MNKESWDVSHDHLKSSCEAVFGSLGDTVHHIESTDPDALCRGPRIGAFIGFSGDALRGTLTLSLPASLIAKAHPEATPEHAVPLDDVRDWAGELANQVLGRYKNSLARHGVILRMSTPTTVWGDHIRPSHLVREGHEVMCFESDEGALVVSFAAIAEPSTDLTQVSVEPEVEHSEGEMVMF